MPTPWVCIIMGSDSDAEVMSHTADALEELGIPYEMLVASAHRTPERTRSVIEDGEKNGAAVFIAGAGAAAHLPGVVASHTMKPVIGVPLPGSALFGLDALFAIAQMPAGVPVATVAIGIAGARNAGILAAQILALADPAIAERVRIKREAMAAQVVEKSKRVERATTARSKEGRHSS